MKTMEELENELRNWEPRAPSASLRARIFDQQSAEPVRVARVRAAGWGQAPLAFASVLGLALIIAVRQNPPAVSPSYSTHAVLAAMSNQDFAAYLSPQDMQNQNRPVPGLECTNLRLLRVSTAGPAVVTSHPH